MTDANSPLSARSTARTLDVDDIMREIEDDVRRARRERLLARGGPTDYRDAQVYAAVDRLLRRAADGRDEGTLLLPELLEADEAWRLSTSLRFWIHRRLLGPAIVFLKRRVLLPATRWLFEYSLENFKRQQRLNRVLMACVEELAIENAKLRKRVAGTPE